MKPQRHNCLGFFYLMKMLRYVEIKKEAPHWDTSCKETEISVRYCAIERETAS